MGTGMGELHLYPSSIFFLVLTLIDLFFCSFTHQFEQNLLPLDIDGLKVQTPITVEGDCELGMRKAKLVLRA